MQSCGGRERVSRKKPSGRPKLFSRRNRPGETGFGFFVTRQGICGAFAKRLPAHRGRAHEPSAAAAKMSCGSKYPVGPTLSTGKTHRDPRRGRRRGFRTAALIGMVSAPPRQGWGAISSSYILTTKRPSRSKKVLRRKFPIKARRLRF